jgi:hypothetical protein
MMKSFEYKPRNGEYLRTQVNAGTVDEVFIFSDRFIGQNTADLSSIVDYPSAIMTAEEFESSILFEEQNIFKKGDLKRLHGDTAAILVILSDLN